MAGLREIALVPAVSVLLLAGGLPAAGPAAAALPERVVVNDSRTSPPSVDIAKVVLRASWYWDSEQSMRVKVPNGFRPGQRLTVYFDVDNDSTPDGHFDLWLKEPKKPGGKYLRKEQEFRVGGGWDKPGEKVRCGGSEGGPPAFDDIKIGQRDVSVVFDLWWCLKRPNPPDSGAWRVAVRLAKGGKADMAPNGRKWSPPVAGWGPCDPAGGAC